MNSLKIIWLLIKNRIKRAFGSLTAIEKLQNRLVEATKLREIVKDDNELVAKIDSTIVIINESIKVEEEAILLSEYERRINLYVKQ